MEMEEESALRQRVEEEFDLSTADPSWRELLDVACRTADTIEQLEALVASDGLLSTGSTGQTTVHPALVELRQQRAAYARLLDQLQGDESFRQRQARYARQRWAK